jgi:hypothetical protein
VSAPPDQAPQSQAHLYYFLAPTKRTYGDGTNLRMSYCHFPTVFDCLRCAPARIALWNPATSSSLADERRVCSLVLSHGGARSEASSPSEARDWPTLAADVRRRHSQGEASVACWEIVCTLVIKDDPPEASGKGRIGACDQKRPAMQPALHRPGGIDPSSWRERAKSRPRVTASRNAYASRGSVGL